MASCTQSSDYEEQLKTSLEAILKDPIESEVAKQSQRNAEVLLENIKEEPVIQFTKELVTKLNGIVVTSFSHEAASSSSKKREKAWTSFYNFRANDLPKMWIDLWSKPQFSSHQSSQWLCQMLARSMMEVIIKENLTMPGNQSHVPTCLSIDEENALRYAGGFILVSIRKKSKDPNVIQWINKQVEESTDTADTYLDYTKHWLKLIDRGGLFHMNDLMFQLVYSMEIILRQVLAQSSHSIDIFKASKIIKEDHDILFYWSLLTVELDEETAQPLLKEIIKIWITIRGFSYASSLLEQYKQSQGVVKRKKSLRKQLKDNDETIS